MNKRLFTFFLGLIIVIVLGKLMFVERHSESDDYYELFASFNKVDGVNPGDNIMISGINVGYVEEVMPHFRQAFYGVCTSPVLENLLEENGVEDVVEMIPKNDIDLSVCLDSKYMYS